MIIMLAGILCVVSAAYVTYLVYSPEKITLVIEDYLRKELNGPVSIGSMTVGLQDGVKFGFHDVNARSRRDFSLRAEDIMIRISPWHLMVGKARIRQIQLAGFDAEVSYDFLVGPTFIDLSKLVIPPFEMERGALSITDEKFNVRFHGMQGYYDARDLDLTMQAFGGHAFLSGQKAENEFEGIFKIERGKLSQVSSRLAGTANVYLGYVLGRNRTYAVLKVLGDRILLPWCDKELDDISCTVALADSGSQAVDIRTIALRTPLFSVWGGGSLSGISDINELGNALLDVDMQSNEFDYESVVDYLPTDYFPEWLRLLLTKQIRGGTSRFPRIHYRGTLNSFSRPEAFAESLVIHEDIMGQSFGSGIGAERVRDVTGKGIFNHGDLTFKNLSGYIGNSQIQSVSFTFAGLEEPEVTLSVDADVDMDFADFVDGWRAVMTEKDLYDMFSPVSEVSTGRIAGSFQTHSNLDTDDPTLMQGEINLQGCSFLLGDERIGGMKATLSKKGFVSPLKTQFSGTFNTIDVDLLDLVFDQPIVNDRYTFSVKTTDIPLSDTIRLVGGKSLRIDGEGDGADFSGTIEVVAEGIELAGTSYRPQEGVIRGEGAVRGVLRPQMKAVLSDIDVTMDAGRLTVNSQFGEETGRVDIKGDIDLGRVTTEVSGDLRALDGTLGTDITVTWNDEITVTGRAVCSHALVYYGDRAVTLNGSIQTDGTKAYSDDLGITFNGTTMGLSGSLSLEKPYHFMGTVTADGIRIEEGEMERLDFPEEITAEGTLRLTNLNFYGIGVDSLEADAHFNEEVLSLDNAVAYLKSGTLSGSVVIPESEKATFHTTISLVDADMKEYLDAFTTRETGIKGSMSIQGDLRGTLDSLNGTIDFSSGHGRILKYSIISKIFSVLNFYKIIKTGELDLAIQGFPYNRLSATYTIQDGVMAFDDFYLDSNSLQLSAVGTYAIKDKRIDALVGVQPLEAVDKTISLIPLLGSIITGEDGKLMVVSLKVQGNFDDPTIVLEPIDTVSKPVTGIIMRTLKLPLDIVDKLQKMAPKKESP